MPDIAVLGLDEHNLETLQRLPHDGYRFHGVLDVDRLIGVDHLDLPRLLEEAETELDAMERVDALVGYWDFPVSTMVPILCHRRGLISASLESVVRCEHKYWSRLEQRKAIEDVPAFGVMSLDDTSSGARLPGGMQFPVWLKPIKSASSALAFKVEDQASLDEAVTQLREGIDTMGEPFQFVLDHMSLPDEITAVGAQAAIVEEAVTGQQVTVEGYVLGDDVRVLGVVDSVTYPDSTSFLRYQYPSTLPAQVLDRLTANSEAVIAQLGLTSCTFNIEYFWDPDTDRVALLEVNPRHSQSHAWLFEWVDGAPNHEAMVALALGREPQVTKGAGRRQVAAKWFLRHFSDGVVTRAPSADRVAEIEAEIGDARIEMTVQEGDRLSEQSLQDSYSFEIAEIHLAADDEDGLARAYERCVELLGVEIDENEGVADDR
jgi:biotin carboxylase